MCTGNKEGSGNSNEKNTPPPKKRKTNKEYLVKFMFASVSQQRMMEWGDELSIYEKKDGMRETVTNLVWSSPEGDGYTPSTKNVIFVDCSSDMGWAYDTSTNYDVVINPRLLFAIEKIKTLLYKKSTKNNEKGKVHCIIAAYHPCEKLMFALSNLFGHSLPEQEVYSAFIGFINGKIEYKYALRWIEEDYGWTFDVQYCCVFEGYDIALVDKTGEEREKHIKGLMAELDEVAKKHNGHSGLEIANGNFEKRDWGDPKYGTDFINLKNHDKWSDDPYYGTGRLPSYNNYDYAVPTINYRGEWCTTNDLKHLIDGDVSPNHMHAQANKMEEAFNEKEAKRTNLLKQIAAKKEALKRQMTDNTSQEYKEWEAIENEEKKNAEKYSKEKKDYGRGYSHHRKDQIEYHGAFVTLDELNEKEDNILKTMAEERQEFESLRDDANKKAKWLQDQEDAKTSIGLALLSIPFPPFAMVDILFEVYKWKRDNESFVDGVKNHGVSMGFDAMGLIPYIGGITKLVRGARLASKTQKALVGMAKASEKLATAEEIIAHADDVADLAKAADKAKDVFSNTKNTIELQRGLINANNEKIAQTIRRMGKNNPATQSKKFQKNLEYIKLYKDSMKGASKELKVTLQKGIDRLEAQNASIKAMFKAENATLRESVKALRAENAAIRKGIKSLNLNGLETAMNKAAKEVTRFNNAVADAKLASNAASGEIIAQLAKYHEELKKIEKLGTTLTALTNENSVKAVLMGTDLFLPSKFEKALDWTSKGWAGLSGVGLNGLDWYNLSVSGFLYTESPQKMDRLIEHQIESLSPETLDLIDENVDEELAMAEATRNFDLTLDNKIQSLMEQRNISEEEAMQALVEQYNMGTVEDNEFEDNKRHSIVNEEDAFALVLRGEYSGEIPDNKPLSDKEIIDFQNDAALDKGIEQKIQADLEKQKEQYLKAHANDGDTLEAADKRYDTAFGNMVDAYSDAQSKVDGFKELMEKEDDPELKAFYKSEMENWQAEADNLDSQYPKPIGLYADTIKEYQDAKIDYEIASDQRNINCLVVSQYDKKIKESKERENDADIKIEKATEAFEAGDKITNANKGITADNKEDAEDVIYFNSIIRKNREDDIRSLMQ